MRAALRTWEHNARQPKEFQQSKRQVAIAHNVSYTSFCARLNGRPSIQAYNSKKQHLTPEEEQTLVDSVLGNADRGIPMSRADIVMYANAILKKKGSAVVIDPQSNWIERFLTRHHCEIQSHWSKPLDTQRASSLNPNVVNHWFEEVVKPCLVKRADGKKILEANIYGMDESGFPPSDQGTQRVMGRRGTKTQHRVGGANRENVTAIVTICADGTALKPTIIFKGKNVMKKWTENNVSGAS